MKEKVLATQAKLERAGKASQPIALFHSDDHAFEGLLKRDDVDLVVIATPWNWHVPMAVAGMKQGKHVAIEVPAARTMQECWDMVNTSEATQPPLHPARELLLRLQRNDGAQHGARRPVRRVDARRRAPTITICAASCSPTKAKDSGAAAEHFNRNGNLYPTHGLGPVAHYMDVNRGDRFDTLVSMSSISAGLQAYRKEQLAADDPRQKEAYKEGDFNVSLIRTVKGRVIELEHNVSSPQPYDRINLIAGTKGIFRDYPAAHLLRWRAARRVRIARPVQGQVRARAVEEGRRAWRRKSAATAAWIT